MSQYTSQLLSILGIMPSFPNSIPAMFHSAIMLNILGGKHKTSHDELVRTALAIPTAALHLYGKESKPARKIGHITIVGSSTSEVEMLTEPLIFLAGAMRAERKTLPTPTPASQSASSGLRTSSSPRPLIAVTMGEQILQSFNPIKAEYSFALNLDLLGPKIIPQSRSFLMGHC